MLIQEVLVRRVSSQKNKIAVEKHVKGLVGEGVYTRVAASLSKSIHILCISDRPLYFGLS